MRFGMQGMFAMAAYNGLAQAIARMTQVSATPGPRRSRKIRRAARSKTYAPNGARECARRQRQHAAEQLDFTASGQPDVKGRRRRIREALEATRSAHG